MQKNNNNKKNSNNGVDKLWLTFQKYSKIVALKSWRFPV